MSKGHYRSERMGFPIKIAFLSALIQLTFGTAARTAGTDQDFDLACAVTSAAEVATTTAGTDARNAAFTINVYFLGRLSGRDSKTFWSAVIKGKVAELREKSKSPEMYRRCMDFVTNQL